MNLSEHFTLQELTITEHRRFDNTPNAEETENLKRLAAFLEEVKEALGGKPVIINSAFRSKQVNNAVGSTDKSFHRKGLAADFRVPNMTPDQVVSTIIKAGLNYDQIIREFDSWTHISISDKPRKQALIIDKSGTRPYVIKA